MRTTMTIAFVLTLIATPNAFGADDLLRKVKTPRESYPNVDVIYDSVTTPHGERLRTIITKPRKLNGKLPVVFVAAWLSCDSVEAPENTRDKSAMLFRQRDGFPGFCLFRHANQVVVT